MFSGFSNYIFLSVNDIFGLAIKAVWTANHSADFLYSAQDLVAQDSTGLF